jgi:hypothetical protein
MHKPRTRSQKLDAKVKRRKKRRSKVTKKQRGDYIAALGKVYNKGIENWKLLIARQERITEEEQFAPLDPNAPEPQIGD